MGHRSRFVPVGVAADLLGISHNSVRNFCKRGELEYVTTMGGHRRVSVNSINRWLGLDEEDPNRKVVYYARVSGKIQRKQGNLARQAERLERYCTNELGEAKENIIGIQDQGSGLSQTRPGFLRLINLLISGQVKILLCEDKDRLARYGVVLLQTLCEKFDVELIVTNQKQQEISEDESMVSEIISICSVFEARRCGRRGTKRTEMPLTEKVRNRVIELYHRHENEVCCLVRWFYVEPFRRKQGKARRALRMLMSCAKEKGVKLICFSSLFSLETRFNEFVSNGAKDMILDDDIEADLEWQKVLIKYGFELCPELSVSPENRSKGRSGLMYCPE
jgi:putative resolvase